MPPQFGRAPAPVPLAAILDVEYCLVDRVIPGEMDEKIFLLLRFYFPRERNRRQGEGGEGGTIDPRLGNQKKKEVRVSKQCKSSTKPPSPISSSSNGRGGEQTQTHKTHSHS